MSTSTAQDLPGPARGPRDEHREPRQGRLLHGVVPRPGLPRHGRVGWPGAHLVRAYDDGGCVDRRRATREKRYKVPYLLPVLTYASHEKNRDPRKQGEAKSLPPSEKVYTLAVQGPRIVVGAADRSVLIYDSRFVKLRIVNGRSRSARSLGIHRSIPLRAQYPPTGT